MKFRWLRSDQTPEIGFAVGRRAFLLKAGKNRYLDWFHFHIGIHRRGGFSTKISVVKYHLGISLFEYLTDDDFWILGMDRPS